MTPGGTQFVDDVVSPVSLCPVPKECGDAAVKTLRIRSMQAIEAAGSSSLGSDGAPARVAIQSATSATKVQSDDGCHPQASSRQGCLNDR